MSNEDIDLTAVYLLGYEKGKAAALKQLKPLTDLEIAIEYGSHAKYQMESMELSGWVSFARAIEKKIRGEA